MGAPPTDTERDSDGFLTRLRIPRLNSEAMASVDALSRALAAADLRLARLATRRYDIATRIPLDQDRLVALLAASLVADAGRLSAGHGHGDARESVASALLGADLVGQLAGLHGVGRVLRHMRERWDGLGGPDSLAGDAIPVESRALAVVDTLAADVERLGDHRTHVGRLRTGRGSAFDPALVDEVARQLAARPLGDPPDAAACLSDLRRRAGLAPEVSPADRLDAIAAAVAELDDPVALAAHFATEAVVVLGADTVSVARIDHGREVLEVLVHAGDLDPADEPHPSGEVYPLRSLPPFSGIGAELPVLLTLSAAGLDDSHVPYLRSRGINSEASAPVEVDGQLWGSIWATTRAARSELGGAQLESLARIARDLGAVLSTARRVLELEELAFRDPLTGLANRRVLERKLQEVFSRPPGDRLDVALVMCDVDGLKLVNDTLGHEEGDRVLRDAAASLREAVVDVPGVTVCRIGGDEFCMIIDGGGALHARPLADRASTLFQRTGATRSMSCGTAVVEPRMKAPGELLRAADVAQYEEKRRRQELGLAPVRPIHAPGTRAGRRARRDR